MMESRLLEIQDIIRNGLMSIHKTLIDARRSLDQTEKRVNLMMDGFQGLIDEARKNGSKQKTGRD
jgi:hypothetical protein